MTDTKTYSIGRSRRRCQVPGCPNDHYAWDYCRPHYRHWKAGKDPLTCGTRPTTRRRSDGYIEKRVNGRWVLSHRWEMEKHLGRPLMKGESVHHKDGVRSNNNLANLELMVSHHPAGQRPQDLVPWAVEILKRYAPDKLAR